MKMDDTIVQSRTYLVGEKKSEIVAIWKKYYL